MKGSSRRPEQVAETVRQVLADALLRGDIRDPRVGLVTVTSVRVTGDLSVARILVSRQGDEVERRQSVEGLKSAAGFLRSLVAKRLTTYTVPELRFELDEGLAHAARIEELLAEVRRADDAGRAQPGGQEAEPGRDAEEEDA